MRCIFCKLDSSHSRSVEHILPQSIGNVEHALSPGVVCDSCNNYFSREVEKPFIDHLSIRLLRFQKRIPSKRGSVPPLNGYLLPNIPVSLQNYVDGRMTELEISHDHAHLLRGGGTLIFPVVYPLPDGPVVSRFLAKVALEAFAARVANNSAWREYLVDEAQFDLARNHARRGTDRDWPYHVRRIYPAESEVIHEFDLLETDQGEWYVVLALFGIEFALNVGGPEIEGYVDWLADHGGQSPLYFGKNAIV